MLIFFLYTYIKEKKVIIFDVHILMKSNVNLMFIC